MREKLNGVTELQKVDLEIASLNKAAETYPKQLAELDKELATAKSAIEAERTRVLELERQRRLLEQNISDEKDKVKKWEGRLSEQRSTREYAALAREIDIAKKSNLTLAEELGELNKSQGVAREGIKAKEQEFIAKQTDIHGRIAELKSKIESTKVQVRTLEEKRTKVASQVDRDLLRRYDLVRKRRLPALVPVIAGTCQGCNMNVPPQLYNTLRTTLGIDICPSCHRIIYAAEAVQAAAS